MIENLLLQIPLELRRINIIRKRSTIETMSNGMLFERQKCSSLTICK